MVTALLMGVVALAILLAVASMLGERAWRKETAGLRARLDAASAPVSPARIDLSLFEGLPAPVQRYLRAVLRDGAPMITGLHARHRGTFNSSEGKAQWKPFTSDQRIVLQRPGFDWNGRIAFLPGVSVRVHDAYVAGEGILHASLLGLFTVADLRDRTELAHGELMRFLAEAPWYPSALLPGQGVSWEAIDTRSARATLMDGALSVSIVYRFGADDLVESVHAEARGRSVGDRILPTPWRGRFWNYELRHGVRVPGEGEVAWVIDGDERPYWRGRLVELEFDDAG